MKHTLILLLTSLLLLGCAARSADNRAQAEDQLRVEENLAQIGYAHLERNNTTEARQAFRRALDVNANSWRAYWGLAMVNEREQDFQRAEEQYQRSLRLGGEPKVRHGYAAMLYNTGRFEQALEQISRVADDEFYLERASAFEDKGYILLRLDRSDQALQAFTRALELDRLMLSSLYSIVEIHFKNGQFQQAVDRFISLDNLLQTQLVSHTPGTLWLGARVAKSAGQSSYSNQLGNKLISQFPTSEEASLYRDWVDLGAS